MRRAIIIGLLLALCPAIAHSAQCDWDQKPGWVLRENQKAGDGQWDLNTPLRFSADFSRRKDVPRIEGYVSAPSGTCGDSLKLTPVGSKKFTASIYRMGYYSNSGARLIRRLESPQSITVDSKMPPGQYLIKLQSKNRASSFIPLLVYSNQPSDVTFISSVLTWQSYNQWGGESLYKGIDGERESRATSVSFDRPYDGDGSGQFRYMEQPLLTMMEQLGLDINYATDFEVERNQELFANTHSIVVGGHSEYWTSAMRNSIDKAVAAGKNLIAFGGNTAYAQSKIVERTLLGRTPYRDLGKAESLLLGSQYFALDIKKDLISNNVWPFTVLKKDAVIKDLYGYEADTAMGTFGPAVQILARAAISPTEKGFVAMSTYYRAQSGAAVLNMGTNAWVCAMNNRCPWGRSFDVATQQQVRMVTAAVLKAVKTSKWPVAQIDIPSRP